MDAFERDARIQQLREQIAEGEARVAERQAAREADPAAAAEELAELIAEHRSKTGYIAREAPAGILYREHNNAALPAAPRPDAGASGWNEWFARSFGNFAAAEREVLTAALVEFGAHIQHEMRQERDAALIQRDREIDTLRAEVREVRGMLADVLKRLEAVTTEVERAYKDHTAITGSFQIELAEQRGRLNAILRDGLR